MMSVRALLKDPGVRPALLAAATVWAAGFTVMEVLVRLTSSPGDKSSVAPVLVQFATAVALTIALILLTLALRGRRRALRWGLTALGLVAAVAIQGLVDVSANWAAAKFLEPTMQRWATFTLGQYIRACFIYAWVFALTLGLAHLALAQGRMRDQQRELGEARAAAAQAQLAMLRYQLNPHFLFNTLNAISTLVVTRRNDAAEEMLTKLSSFLRASLASEPDDYVTLDAELDVIQEYLDIEGVRFGSRLAVDFACDPAAGPMLVPSFLLQPLVENAIKYAVGPASRTVTIKIDARIDGDDLLIMVADDGDAEKATTRGGTGVGLPNVRARLATLYGARGVLEAVPLERGFLAIVRLPASGRTGNIVPFPAGRAA